MNFEELPDPVAKLDELMRKALPTLFEELLCSDCYVREHEVVHLFVFGHLVPLLQLDNLDLRQIGIEYPVRKIVQGPKSKPGARKDLVIWPRVGATRWNNHQPLAVVEWKHISRLTGDPRQVKADYAKDIEWLKLNREMMQVGFAVLVERAVDRVSLDCKKVLRGEVSSFMELPAARSAHNL